MKKLTALYAAFCFMALSSSVFAAANAITYNTAAYASEDKPGTAVLYYGVTPATTALDSVGTHYTQALWIQPYTESNADFYLVMSDGTVSAVVEDCDVYVEYSFDRTTWFVGSANSGKIKDNLTTTAVSDTLNIIVGSEDLNYKFASWMRFKFVYQTGNPIGTIVTWKAKFFKPTNVPYPSYKILNKN
jgi:hypothetical protein